MFSPEQAPVPGRELVIGVTTFYRFDDHPSLTDQYDHLIILRRYLLARVSSTGKTAWIDPAYSGDRQRRVLLGSHRPYAVTEVPEAWRLFQHRKRWQVSFLADQLKRAEATLLATNSLDPQEIAFYDRPAPINLSLDLSDLP